MSDNERDTHFQGFAKRLWQEMLADGDREIPARAGDLSYMMQDYFSADEAIPNALYLFEQDMQRIIARHAYDLVRYAAECIGDRQLEEDFRFTPEHMLDCVPDLTEWPEKEKSNHDRSF